MDNFWNTFSGQLPPIPQPTKRKIFVSYHHRNDQAWYNSFSQTFGTQFDLFHDTSLERQIDSDNTQYIAQTIRDSHIKGSSLTIILCGLETHKRRWVDWEIHATLEDEHAVLAIQLPSLDYQSQTYGQVYVPTRLSENINNGYAHFVGWPSSAQELLVAIEAAIQKSSNKSLIRNTAPKMQRSRT